MIPAAGVAVRRARPDEAAPVAWLAALTFPLACPPGTAAAEVAAHVAAVLTPANFAAWASSGAHVLLVAERGGELLGYALIQRDGPPADVAAALGCAGPAVELSKFYVHPSQIGRGLAAHLMRAAIAEAASCPLWLSTNVANARAQAFYRKNGFETVGERANVVGGRVHCDVVMARR